MGWSINPSDLASIDSNGKVTFLPHTEKNITYTVTYSDANFTCSKSCTVYKCVEPCTCANANLNVAVSSYGVNIPGSGYTTSKTIGTYNINTCLTGLTATSVDNWVTIVSIGSGNINASIQSNPSFTNSRSSAITVKGYDSEGNSCTDTFTISQLPPICNCDTANFNVSIAPDGTSIPASGYTSLITIGTYNSATCLTGVTATSSENWVTNISVSNGNVNAKVSENASLTNNRTSTITVKGIDGGGNECIGTFIVTQVMSASTCTCANENFQSDATAEGSSIPAEGYSTSTAIGEYTYPTCLTGVTATSNVNWVTITNVSNGTVNATVQSNSSIENGRTGIITVSGVDAYGTTCSDPFDVSQVPSAITCTCDSLTVSPRLNCIPESGGTNINLGTYSDGGCITNIGASSKPDWISDINFSNGNITGNVSETNKYTERTDIIVVTGMAATQTCSKDLAICQEPKPCEDSLIGIEISAETDCEEILEIHHVDFGEVKGKHLENGECVTYTVVPAQSEKTLYIRKTNNDKGDSGGTAIAKNTTDHDIVHPVMDLYYNEASNRYYTYSVTTSGKTSFIIGKVYITQDKCKCDDCAPGTDNYVVMRPEGGEYPYAQLHPLNFTSESGARTGDSQDCGYVYADCGLQMTFKEGWMGDYEQRSTDASIYDFVRINLNDTPQGIVTGFPGGTNVGTNLGFITTSANNSWMKRYAVYTVTPYNKTASCLETSTCTGCTGENLPFCSSWLMAFSQEGAYGCGCSDIGYILPSDLDSIPQTGATFDLCSYNIHGLFCVYEGPWLYGSSTLIYDGTQWRYPTVSEVYPWISFVTEVRSDDRIYVKLTVTANDTGAPRHVSLYLEINMNDMTDCDRYPGFTQLG